jgi:methyl-accepting chemotaxis protein
MVARTTQAHVRAPLPARPAGAIVSVMKPLVVLASLLAIAVGVAACGGQSKSDKAKTQVCDARADIQKQVDTLKGLTLSTATTGQFKDSFDAISSDLKTIANAQKDLAGDRKSQVEQANKQFKSQLQGIVSSFGSTTSLSQASSQLTAALQQLATSYQQTFAKINCG